MTHKLKMLPGLAIIALGIAMNWPLNTVGLALWMLAFGVLGVIVTVMAYRIPIRWK